MAKVAMTVNGRKVSRECEDRTRGDDEALRGRGRDRTVVHVEPYRTAGRGVEECAQRGAALEAEA